MTSPVTNRLLSREPVGQRIRLLAGRIVVDAIHKEPNDFRYPCHGYQEVAALLIALMSTDQSRIQAVCAFQFGQVLRVLPVLIHSPWRGGQYSSTDTIRK